MWNYSKERGWEETGDFLLVSEELDMSDQLSKCGFISTPTLELGKSENFAVEIYHRIKDGTFVAYTNPETEKPRKIPLAIDVKHEFVAVVDIGGDCHAVALSKLPDLLSFLSEIVPICREVRQNSLATEKVG